MSNEERDRAIRELQNSINVGLCPDIESRKVAIKALSQHGWIPVSEGLPYIGERVLVTTETLDSGKMVTGTYYDRYGFVCGNVLAWMPLPEPFESQKSEE